MSPVRTQLEQAGVQPDLDQVQNPAGRILPCARAGDLQSRQAGGWHAS